MPILIPSEAGQALIVHFRGSNILIVKLPDLETCHTLKFCDELATFKNSSFSC